MAKHKVKRYGGKNESLTSSDEIKYESEPAKERVGRGFGADDAKPSADEAEFMATQETDNPVTSSNEKTINYKSDKPKVVTKEELAKSGLTLREYMNKQQGLKSRGESASTTTKASTPSMASTSAKTNTASTPTAPIDETKLSLAERAALTRNRARSGTTTDTRPVNQRMREALGLKKGGVTAKYMSFTKTGKPDGMKPVTKMASGGATASRRADGIAQRGKTRGKMC
jgi:hypothetical protein